MAERHFPEVVALMEDDQECPDWDPADGAPFDPRANPEFRLTIARALLPSGQELRALIDSAGDSLLPGREEGGSGGSEKLAEGGSGGGSGGPGSGGSPERRDEVKFKFKSLDALHQFLAGRLPSVGEGFQS